jgi:hypothetical protein
MYVKELIKLLISFMKNIFKGGWGAPKQKALISAMIK